MHAVLKPLLTNAASRLTDWLFPPLCPVSGQAVDRQGMVSPAAWTRLRFLMDPCCLRCGLPLPFLAEAGRGGDVICPSCLSRPPAFSRARGALAYDDASREMILRFKHGDQTQLAPALAGLMLPAARTLWPDENPAHRPQALLPVPLHPGRLFRRRYNQSLLLARELGSRLEIPVLPDALIRTRSTPTQGGLTARQRRRNVQGAFAIPEHARAAIENRHLALIDDVFTTGATLDACAHTLLSAGAKDVDILTLARVVRE